MFLEYFQKLEFIVLSGLIEGPELPQLAGTAGLGHGLQQPRNILRPNNILQLLIVIKVKVIQLLVVQFLLQNLLNEFVYVFYFTIYEPLEHAEPLGVVKDLKSSDAPQHIHRLVVAIVDPVVGVLVKHVQD